MDFKQQILIDDNIYDIIITPINDEKNFKFSIIGKGEEYYCNITNDDKNIQRLKYSLKNQHGLNYECVFIEDYSKIQYKINHEVIDIKDIYILDKKNNDISINTIFESKISELENKLRKIYPITTNMLCENISINQYNISNIDILKEFIDISIELIDNNCVVNNSKHHDYNKFIPSGTSTNIYNMACMSVSIQSPDYITKINLNNKVKNFIGKIELRYMGCIKYFYSFKYVYSLEKPVVTSKQLVYNKLIHIDDEGNFTIMNDFNNFYTIITKIVDDDTIGFIIRTNNKYHIKFIDIKYDINKLNTIEKFIAVIKLPSYIIDDGIYLGNKDIIIIKNNILYCNHNDIEVYHTINDD